MVPFLSSQNFPQNLPHENFNVIHIKHSDRLSFCIHHNKSTLIRTNLATNMQKSDRIAIHILKLLRNQINLLQVSESSISFRFLLHRILSYPMGKITEKAVCRSVSN